MKSIDRSLFFSDRAYPLRALAGLGTALALALFAVSPWLRLGEEAAFMNFADRRAWMGIPNTLDVLSNVGFLIAAAVGLAWSWPLKRPGFDDRQRAIAHCAAAMFAAVFATGLGSAWFHWNPTHETLLWDRLPMAIGFAAIIALLLADRVSARLGIPALAVLSGLGLTVVLEWQFGASSIPYAAFQAGTVIGAVLIATFFQNGALSNKSALGAVGLYTAAKAFELADRAIFDWSGGWVAGHAVKHLLAAAAIAVMAAGVRAAFHPANRVRTSLEREAAR